MKAVIMAALLATGSAAMAEVRTALSVQSAGGKVAATVLVENRGKIAVQIPKVVAEDDELFGPYFEVREKQSGKVLDYVGPKVKRGPLGPDDYLSIKPGKRLRHAIDITQAYAFLPGQHDYEIRYAGSYIAGLNSAPVAPLSFAPATFSYKP